METVHDGAVAVVGIDGELVAATGDIDRPFFIRSSAKPFQGLVSHELAGDLTAQELAIACSSHRGHPAQLGMVSEVLARGGLSETDLQCPPAWPLSPAAMRLVAAQGGDSPRPLWHNCSGKHAGFLRACRSAGLPIDTYLDPIHPIQESILGVVRDLGEFDPQPVGIDGCGAPVFRTTTRAMAKLYARLGSESRLKPVYEAMHQYPALVGGTGEGDTEIAVALDAAAKGGAEGCVGVALRNQVGVAAKSWDGRHEIAYMAAAWALDELGYLPSPAREALDEVMNPRVFGGGQVQGRFESTLALSREKSA